MNAFPVAFRFLRCRWVEGRGDSMTGLLVL
jgi:hypothetical protein